MDLTKIRLYSGIYLEKAKEYFLDNFLLKYFWLWIIIGLWTTLLFGIGQWNNNDWSTIQYTVTVWDIEDSIKAYGTAELVDEQELRFNQQWEVTAVYFNDGDIVKKWDIIAELDQDSVINNITQAEISLQNAQLSLNEVLNGNSDSQILQAENNLEQSKLKLEVAKQEYQNLLTEKKNFIANQTNSISGSVSNYDSSLANMKIELQNIISEWKKTLITLDSIFGVTNAYKTANDEFEIYLSAKNTSYKLETKSNISKSYSSLESLANYFDNNLNNWLSEDALSIWFTMAKNTFEIIYDATDSAYSALEKSVSSTVFSENTIENYKNTVSGESSSIKWSLTTIINNIDKINNLTDLDNTKNNYEKSLQDYNIKIQAKKNELTNLEKSVTIQQEIYWDIKNWSSYEKIAQAQNSVTQKQLSLKNAKKDLDNLKLKASFDGIVRKIDFKVWDNITSDEKKYVYLENPDLIEISILLDQIDIVKVQEWMAVEVELDSYPWIIFKWILGEIDSTPIISAWVVSYTVKVSIDKWEKNIYSGMTAAVKIILEKKENIIQIPTSYIKTIWDKKVVLDMNNNPLEIKVWSTDGVLTEIISGLKIWDIIKKQEVTVNTNSETKWWGNIGMMWIWGGMWWWRDRMR